jgi:hypothetical protein
MVEAGIEVSAALSVSVVRKVSWDYSRVWSRCSGYGSRFILAWPMMQASKQEPEMVVWLLSWLVGWR